MMLNSENNLWMGETNVKKVYSSKIDSDELREKWRPKLLTGLVV